MLLVDLATCRNAEYSSIRAPRDLHIDGCDVRGDSEDTALVVSAVAFGDGDDLISWDDRVLGGPESRYYCSIVGSIVYTGDVVVDVDDQCLLFLEE